MSSSSLSDSYQGDGHIFSMSTGLAPGMITTIEDPGTEISGFSVRGITNRALIPITVRKIMTIR